MSEAATSRLGFTAESDPVLVPADLSNLRGLCEKEFVFVTGKGGVGKSTVAALIALFAAEQGKRVLVAYPDGSSPAEELWGARVTKDPAPVLGNIDACVVSAEQSMREYAREVIGSKTLADLLFQNQVARGFLTGIPGLSDWAILGKTWSFTRSATFGLGLGGTHYDLVVMDAPASGDGTKMLGTPDVICEVTPGGRLGKDAEACRDTLKSHEKSAVVLVALAEQLVVSETEENYEWIRDRLKMGLGPLFVNHMKPRLFSDRDCEILAQMNADARAPGSSLNESALVAQLSLGLGHAERQSKQRAHLQKLKEMGLYTYPLPHLGVDLKGTAGLKRLQKGSRRGADWGLSSLCPMNDARLAQGTVLAEKYEIQDVIGEGGMGTVYRAQHLALKSTVAVKVIDREVGEGDVALSRFMREAQAAAALQSIHVVNIFDYGMEGDRPFMVMELLQGETLSDRLKNAGRLTAEETFRVLSHVAKGVSRAHDADIIHRDLKPENVFLVDNEGDEIAKVLDFGVAKVEATALDGDGHTRTGSLLGTPYYMSPEQAQGNKDIDHRSDLWALGVIAFECMTGTRPFSSDGLGDLVIQICIRDIPVPSSFVPVPEGFDGWFLKACNREPQDRFQTARELTEGLRSALGLPETGSIPESRWSKAAGSTRAPSSNSKTRPDPMTSMAREATTEGDGEATTERDEVPPRPTLQSEEPDIQAPSSEGPATARTSQWQVVPHGQKSNPPEEAPTPRGSSSLLLPVALLALVVGAGAVFVARSSLVPGSAEEEVPIKAPPQTTPPGSEKAQAKKPGPRLEPKPAPSSVTAETQEGTDAEEEDPDAEPGLDAEEEDSDSSLEAAEEADEQADGEPTEDDSKLDAIEAEAKEKADAAPDKGPPDGAAPRVDPTPKDSATDGPTPTLPDGLQPVPEPPPPHGG